MSNNLKKRLISASVLIALLFVSIIFRPVFIILMFAVALLMLAEWFDMTKSSKIFCLSGLIIIPLPIAAILLISALDHTGEILIFFILTITAIDSAAMFGGKCIKGPRLAPQVSPKKTVSGLISGMFAASLMPPIFNIMPRLNLIENLSYQYSIFELSLMCACLALISQGSDLFISLFKRRFHVKDTGKIIPGHGGVLDRLDSYIFTAPIVLVFLLNASLG